MTTSAESRRDDAATTAAWVEAEAHALAAAALLDDPSVPPWTAAHSLRRGYAALARAAGRENPTTIGWLPAAPSVVAALRGLETDDDRSLDPSALRALAVALSRGVNAAARDRFAPERHRDRRRRAILGAAIGVATLGLAAVMGVVTIGDWRHGPWRAQYFANANSEGPPLVRREGEVNGRWGRASPDPTLPVDRFSARYDTCMVLDADLEIMFVLTSDDGSRLYVDGELVLDNWGVHSLRPLSALVPVTAGTHHLRVDHFDDRGTSMVELTASLSGELPDLIPVRLLRYPGDDPAIPCAEH